MKRDGAGLVVYGTAWLVLALVTLVLLIRDGQSLAVALVAWGGGVVTVPLLSCILTVSRSWHTNGTQGP